MRARKAQRELLLRAAEEMTRNAEQADAGPWVARDDENSWSLHAKGWPVQILKAPKRGTPYAEYWPSKGTAAHLETWSPDKALAVAAALRSCAYRPTDAMVNLACLYLGEDREQYGAAPAVLLSRLRTMRRLRLSTWMFAGVGVVLIVTRPRHLSSVLAGLVLLGLAVLYQRLADAFEKADKAAEQRRDRE